MAWGQADCNRHEEIITMQSSAYSNVVVKTLSYTLQIKVYPREYPHISVIPLYRGIPTYSGMPVWRGIPTHKGIPIQKGITIYPI